MKNEIIKSIKELGLYANTCDQEYCSFLIIEVIKKFSKLPYYQYPLCSNMTDSISLFNPNGWQLIRSFEVESEKILFLEPEISKVCFQFENSLDVVSMLENSYGFVFYITNLNLDYLICFNDHDYLIGCGTAKDWIKSLDRKDETENSLK